MCCRKDVGKIDLNDFDLCVLRDATSVCECVCVCVCVICLYADEVRSKCGGGGRLEHSFAWAAATVLAFETKCT